MKQNPLECEEVNVSVTSSAPARLVAQKHQAATSACFSARGCSMKFALPQLRGLVLELSLGTRWPARGV